MRPIALICLVAACIVGAISIITAEERLSAARAGQERQLEAAASAQLSLLRTAERVGETGTAVLTGDPAVQEALSGRPIPAAVRQTISSGLKEFAATALMPVTAACLFGQTGKAIGCWPTTFSLSPKIATGFLETVRTAPQREGPQNPITALSGAGSGEVISDPFLAPRTATPTVALLVPVHVAGRFAGAVALIPQGSAPTDASGIIAPGTPGARIELAAYTNGTLALNDASARLTAKGFESSGRLPLRAVQLGERPLRLLLGGHWRLIVPLPLTFGRDHSRLAAVITAVAPAPTLLSSLSPALIIGLLMAILLLGGSLAFLAWSFRKASLELQQDPLTGLRNRRALLADLQRACRRATKEHPAYLWLLDLDGFKRYNDGFGRAAGDRMLRGLARRLEGVVSGRGKAYRLGGDEFAVLVDRLATEPETVRAQLTASLAERGGAFKITCSAGEVVIPQDTAEPAQALLLADQRMYQEKAARGVDTAELVTAVLTAALAQRHPDLGDHSDEVAEEVELLAKAVGLEGQELERVKAAASLHDIGKLGVPDRIITKPGPLDDQEWEFMRQHTVIGERIIQAAGLPLEGVAHLVRSSHERWDGGGYPDGLAGEQIPLGARIISICDAYGAMLAERPYKRAMTVDEALAELRRCAGTQFDPELVAIFCQLIEERRTVHARINEG